MALSRHHAATARPLSVEEIVRQAQDFEFVSGRPLQLWLRSAKLLLTEAAMCEQDGNLQMAYLYLYRHADLVIGKLPQHPDYKNPKYKDELTHVQRAVQRDLVKLEQWRPRINQDHRRYTKAMERRNAEKQRIQDEHRNSERQRISDESLRRLSIISEDDAALDLREMLRGSEHRQLAVDLAHREIQRRDATRQSTKQAGISPGTAASRRKGLVVGPSDTNDMLDGLGPEAAAREVHGTSESDEEASRSHRKSPSQTYRYPSVPTKEGTIEWQMPTLQPQPRPATLQGPAPALPEKQHLHDSNSWSSSYAPPVPAKSGHSVPSSPPTATPSPPSMPVALSPKYTFKPTAFTEAGAPLRTVFLPPELRTTFLNVAHPNTLGNKETCGILCGTVVSNALFISHLIIPDQNSTSDTCDTTEEGDNALFDYCDGADLLVCGWIHTHPTQSCFLSSRDLHTSSGYQVMLPEAIAIVCAPRHNPEWGIFRLTDPPGLPAVLSCHQQGLFHPHAEKNLYTDALRPGHVVEGPGLKFHVVDLRKV